MEVIWCALPRAGTDPQGACRLHFAPGRVVVLIGRADDWQVGCVVPPGSYAAMKEHGPPGLQAAIAGAVPWLADRVHALADWRSVNVLRIEADRVDSWHRPGLLLIGDAAHAMLPVGGVGLNCAVADAVEAANVLATPLLAGRVTDHDVRRVQRRRERVTAIVQRFQRMQHRVLDRALSAHGPVTLPLPLRLALRTPLVRRLPARLMGLGLKQVHVRTSAAPP
jgi:2-polyprenyl-6-methoxyphenol hydroxylase-like FAD-dependent oxidoreductase